MIDGAVILRLLTAADAAVLERAGGDVFDHAVKPLVALLLERGRQLDCAEASVATEEKILPARALDTSLAGRENAARAVVCTFPLQADPASGEPHP